MRIIIFLTLLSTATVSSAWFWDKVEHKVEHVVNKEKKIASDVANGPGGVVTVGKVVEHEADLLCRKALGVVLKQVIGKTCKTAVTEFGAECIAELETETEGMATVACTAASAALGKECKHELTSVVADLVEDEACGK